VATPSRWTILLTTTELIDEMRQAKSDEISIVASNVEELQTEYTMGMGVDDSTYHVVVVGSIMTRNLTVKFDEVYDEIVKSFQELIPANETEWLAIPALKTMQTIVGRTSNRLFLGLPICRNSEWIALNIQFAIDIFLAGATVNAFPRFLHPLVGRLLAPTAKALHTAKKFLKDEVVQRLEMDAEHGKKYDGRPNDLISWLLDAAPEEERTLDRILTRLLIVNMAAIHTTSNTFTQTLFYLAAYPEYVEPMREEVKNVIKEHGWTKASLNQMRKLDSFVKESARIEGLDAVLMRRKIVKPSGYTFANGLYVPCGSFIGVPTFAIHHDEANYDNPYAFDGFRFSKRRDDDSESLKHQMVATSLDYLNFGHGKYACPGRFFAATELKAMLAHVLMTYDVGLENDVKPKSVWFGPIIAPDVKTKILFRRLRN